MDFKGGARGVAPLDGSLDQGIQNPGAARVFGRNLLLFPDELGVPLFHDGIVTPKL